MASSSQSPAGGKPVAQGPLGAMQPAPGGYKTGMTAPSGNPGGNGLAALFMGNQGYGGGGSGVSLPNVTQPTRQSLGLPATLTLPPRTPVQQPAAPAPRAPTAQEVGQRIQQLGPMPTYSQNGGVNAMDANAAGASGKAGRFAEYYTRLKAQNPTLAQQVLERSPYRSIFDQVQGAAPQQPYQPSQTAQLARSMNERYQR